MCDSVLYRNYISAVCNEPNSKNQVNIPWVLIILVGQTASLFQINVLVAQEGPIQDGICA